jgi:excisionase family DNA binding protein
MTMTTEVRFMKTDEVAELLRVSRGTVQRYWRDGRLPGVKLGPRMIRFDERDVEAFISGGGDAAVS